MIIFRLGFCKPGIECGNALHTKMVTKYDKKNKESSKFFGIKFGFFRLIWLSDALFQSLTEVLRGIDKDPDWMTKNRKEVSALIEKTENAAREKYLRKTEYLRTEIDEQNNKIRDLKEEQSKLRNQNNTLRKAFTILEQVTERGI